jgi:small conductance mechanosensitive channel
MDEENTAGSDAVANFDLSVAMDWLRTDGLDFAVNVVAAIAIFVIGRIVVRVIVSALRKAMQRNEVEKTLESFICNLVRIALMVVVIIAAIDQLGVATTSFIAVFGAAGLAVGLALQGSLSNFAAGVLIVLFRPYKAGDFIEAGGVAGSVEEVQILTTILKTPDNKKVIVPNGQILGNVITNYSAHETRRVELVVGVSYADDLDKVKQTLRELVDADERILDDPECQIALKELADSSVNFVVRPWVKTDDYWGVYFDLTEAIKKRFDNDGISFPFPQRDVHLYNETAA